MININAGRNSTIELGEITCDTLTTVTANGTSGRGDYIELSLHRHLESWKAALHSAEFEGFFNTRQVYLLRGL